MPMVFDISARALRSVPKAPALDLAEATRRSIPLALFPLAHHLRHGFFIAAPEAFAIFIPQPRWHGRITVFIAVVWVGAAVVLSISARPLHSLLIATPLDLAETIQNNLPTMALRFAHLHWRRGLGPHRGFGPMSNSNRVSTAEAIAVRLPQIIRKLRMPILIAIVDVRPPVVLKIPARPLHPIVKTAPLRFVQLARRHIPAALLPCDWNWRT
jgi:hypothetical protein